VTGVSADGEGRNVEEAGLKGVSGGDDTDMVRRGLEWEDRGKDGAGREEVLVGRVL